jgi:hypothetical protein
MKRYTLLRTDGTTEVLTNLETNTDGEPSFKSMYPIIGCDMIEIVNLNEKSLLYCDEEGLLKSNWVANQNATSMYQRAYNDQSLGIVGNAILEEEV